MNSIDRRIAKLRVRRAREIEAQEAVRVVRLKDEEVAFQERYAIQLQKSKNKWDRYYRKCQRMGWPLPSLDTRPSVERGIANDVAKLW